MFHRKNSKIMEACLFLLIIILNTKDKTIHVKGRDWKNRWETLLNHILCTRNSLWTQRHKWTEVREGKNNCHANSNQKKSKEALLMLDKIDSKSKLLWETKKFITIDKRFNLLRKHGNYKQMHQRTSTYMWFN